VSRLYENIFKFRVGDTDEKGGCTFVGGSWVDKTTDDLFKNKKIVMFGLPGAFTPTCSGEQLPKYEERYDEFISHGVDDVYCISVNDAFVMNAWARDLGIEKVKMIPDGDGAFTRSLGMLVNKPVQGFGLRSWRYSAFIDNEVIEHLNEEPGKNNLGLDSDPYEISDPDSMLEYFNMAK